MKGFIFATVFFCALGSVVGQDIFDCQDCSGSTNSRRNETGCRSFCVFDLNSNSLVERAEYEAVMNRSKNADGVIERDAFVSGFTRNTGMCESEGNAAFEEMAEMGDGDPSVVDNSDIAACWEVYIDPDGKGAVNKAEYTVSWEWYYEIIVDETC